VKFLIVAVDYFTKWIEAKPLTTITTQQVQQFVWKDIICRYGVPHTIITDNGRQFIDKELAKFYTHQVHHKFCRTSTNQWTSRGGKESYPREAAQKIRYRQRSMARRVSRSAMGLQVHPSIINKRIPIQPSLRCRRQPTTTKTWPYISTFYLNSEKKPRYAI